MSSFLGTARLVSPDIWKARLQKTPYKNQVDLWPIGVIILGYGLFHGLPPAPKAQKFDLNSNVNDWLRWSRALPSATCPIRPGWKDLVEFGKRILRRPPSAAACTHQLLNFVGLPTPTPAGNLRFLQSLDPMPISPTFVRIDIGDPLPYSLHFTKPCRALEMPLEAIKDGLAEAVRTGAGAGDYVSFEYAAEVFRRFDDGRELDEAMEIAALQELIERAHLASWPFEPDSVEE
jgi:hypothetical protein